MVYLVFEYRHGSKVTTHRTLKKAITEAVRRSVECGVCFLGGNGWETEYRNGLRVNK